MPSRIAAVLAASLVLAACGDESSSQDMSGVVHDLATYVDFAQTIHDLLNADALAPSCPTGTIPPSLHTLFAGDTAFNKNVVTDPRVQWAADPDAALVYVAPQAGTYRVSVTSSDQPSTNDCGVVLRDYGGSGSGALYDEAICPTGAMIKMIDSAYAATPGGTTADIDLTSGQHVVMFVSCSMFAAPKKTISYVVHVDLQ